MPPLMHGSCQSWLQQEFELAACNHILTLDDILALRNGGSSRKYLHSASFRMLLIVPATDEAGFHVFGGAYRGSMKEPDSCILPRRLSLPTIVLEAGWSETWTKLHVDDSLWIQGGAPHVNVLLLIKWTKASGQRVTGRLEVWRKGGIDQSEVYTTVFSFLF